jgi:transposase InsO family protein
MQPRGELACARDIEGLGARPGKGHPPAKTSLRQRLELHRSRLGQWARRPELEHFRGAPYHPMSQGKIERWHQTLKNRILLENYYLAGDPKLKSRPSSLTIITCAILNAW